MALLAGVALGVGGAPRLAADIADDLARIAVEAAGGVKAHEGLRSFRAVGVTTVGEAEAPFVLYAARPRSVRIETTGEKGSLVRAFDGVHAPWRRDDPLLPPRRLGRMEEREFVGEADFDSPFFDYAARRISLDYAGEETIAGRLCQKLLATLRHTDTAVLYLDAETHLLVRRDEPKVIDGRRTVLETHYADFVEVAGVRLPGRIRVVADGRVLTDTRIKRYEANPSLPADFFAPPVKDWPVE